MSIMEQLGVVAIVFLILVAIRFYQWALKANSK